MSGYSTSAPAFLSWRRWGTHRMFLILGCPASWSSWRCAVDIPPDPGNEWCPDSIKVFAMGAIHPVAVAGYTGPAYPGVSRHPIGRRRRRALAQGNPLLLGIGYPAGSRRQHHARHPATLMERPDRLLRERHFFSRHAGSSHTCTTLRPVSVPLTVRISCRSASQPLVLCMVADRSCTPPFIFASGISVPYSADLALAGLRGHGCLIRATRRRCDGHETLKSA